MKIKSLFFATKFLFWMSILSGSLVAVVFPLSSSGAFYKSEVTSQNVGPVETRYWLPPQVPSGIFLSQTGEGVEPQKFECQSVLSAGQVGITWSANEEEIWQNFEYQLAGQENSTPTGDHQLLLSDLGEGEYGVRVRSVGSNNTQSEWSQWCNFVVQADQVFEASVAGMTSQQADDQEIEVSGEDSSTGGDAQSNLLGWLRQGVVTTVTQDLTTQPSKSGQDMIQLGGVSQDPEEVSIVSQQLETGSGLDQISFWYKFVTYDERPLTDDPGMMVLIDGRVVYQQWASDILRQGEAPYSQGWKQLVFDVSALDNPTLTIAFYGGVSANPDQASYVYLDGMVVSRAATENADINSQITQDEATTQVIKVAKWPLDLDEAWVGPDHQPWFEIRNSGLEDIDLAQWSVRNRHGREVSLSDFKLDNDLNPQTQEMIVKAGGYLVAVDDQDFLGPDRELISLYDQDDELVATLEVGELTDPEVSFGTMLDSVEVEELVATPGRQNVKDIIDLEPEARIWAEEPSQAWISIFDALNYQTAWYVVEYQYGEEADVVREGFSGQIDISELRHDVHDLKFATCSGGGDCVAHVPVDPETIFLEVTLSGSDLPDKTITQDLTGDWPE